MGFYGIYPLVICYIAIENGPVICDLPIQIVIFHSYVKLPEGRIGDINGYQWIVMTGKTNSWRTGKLPLTVVKLTVGELVMKMNGYLLIP